MTNLPQAGGGAADGPPFVFEGVVLCYDPGWHQMFVCNGSETRYFAAQSLASPLHQGEYVKVTGVTVSDGVFTNLHAERLGKKPLPAPRPIELAQLAGTIGQWVEIEGQVRAADTSVGRLELAFHQSGQNCVAFVMGPPGSNSAALMGARVRLRGINTTTVANGRLTSPLIIVPGTNDVVSVEPPRVDLMQLPVWSIDSLLHRELGVWTNEMVHLNGRIEEYRPGDYLILKDPTGLIRADLAQTTPVQLGERADVWGFVTLRADGIRLDSAGFICANPPVVHDPSLAMTASSIAPATNGLNTLTTAAAIRRLTAEEAARGYPVRLRGVLTYADPDWHTGFVQDDTDALWVQVGRTDLQCGELVEVTGRTGPGDFAPVVVNASFAILARTNLLPPIPADLEDLADGHLDSRWIQVEGVIRRAETDTTHLRLVVMGDREKFTVIVPNWTNQPIPAQWVDSRMLIRGVCATDVNRRRQLGGITIYTPDISYIHTIEAAQSDPFAASVIPIASVATFNPGRAGRRVAVTGVVTMVLPGRGFVLQDPSGGIRVQTEQTNPTHVGDKVEAVGFPALGEFSPHLESAFFRRLGTAALPRPTKVTAEEVLREGANNNTGVELRAVLLQKVARSLEPKLVLQDGPVIFTATLLDPKQADAAAALAPGSLLRLRGVCLVDGNPSRGAEAFHLALSQPGAVELLQAPPSWTAQEILKVAGGMGAAIIAALAWIGLLRRQVRTQTEVIRSSQKQIIEASRQAGMAEVATGVLHNVGNVLNSVNVSTAILSAKVKQSKVGNLSKVAAMLREHESRLADFVTRDAQGRQIPAYLEQVAEHLAQEQNLLLKELALLEKNVEHIKSIVTMQQSYAKVAGYVETVQPADLVEDALRLNAAALSRHHVEIRREYGPSLPALTLDKHKVLQVLVNLIQNAKYACDHPEIVERRVTLRVTNGEGRLWISVIDTGIGIPRENLTKIFSMGFSTRQNGHGYGLHSGALAARELGGTLLAQSDGPGKGATFTLELPVARTLP